MRVYNDRGDFEGVARVTDDVPIGVVVATLGYWRSLNRSDGSVNSISSDALLRARPRADLLRQSRPGRQGELTAGAERAAFSSNWVMMIRTRSDRGAFKATATLFGGDGLGAFGLHLLQRR